MGTKGSDSHRRNFPATISSSFFKIILPSVIHDNKLRIPEKFAKQYGNELSTFAMLTVPNGRIWHVEVERAENMLWFHDGWKDFAEHHSIRFGFFMVFKYEGYSNFSVLIFDLTASEIDYPRNTLRISEEPNHGKQYPVAKRVGMEGDDPGEILRSSVRFSVPRPTPVSSENKVFDECLDQRTICRRCYHSSLQNLFEFAPEYALRIDKQGSCVSSLESRRFRHRYMTRNKRYKMEDLGEIIKLENITTSCKGKLRASEMPSSQGSVLGKPEKDKWNLTKNVENLRATVPLVRDWGLYSGSKLKNHIDRADITNQHPTKDSVFEHIQRSKDMCSQSYEIKHTKNAIDVKLLSSDAANQRTGSNGWLLEVKHEEETELLDVNTSGNFIRKQLVTTHEREKAAAMMFKPENPFFTVIMHLYNLHRGFLLHVPSEFARNYLHTTPECIDLLVADGKQWKVRCVSVKGKVQSLSKGWATFARENHLVKGDVCLFELIQVKDIVLKVSIFRKA